MTLWPQQEAVVLDLYFSDHYLLCVTLEEQQGRGSSPFKILNHLASHPEFMDGSPTLEYASARRTNGENMEKAQEYEELFEESNYKGFLKMWQTESMLDTNFKKPKRNLEIILVIKICIPKRRS